MFIQGQSNNKQNLFVNRYVGNFAQQMSLNRKAVERVLEIAHLDGKVVLTRFVPSSQSTSEAQGNELAPKRFFPFGEKINRDEEENPLSKVVSIPEGWKIEINDTRIRKELENKQNLTGKELQTAFIKKFNGLVTNKLLECIRIEKLSSKKDRYFISKFCRSALVPVMPITITVFLSNLPSRPLAGLDIWVIHVINFVGTFCSYGIFNLLNHQINKENKRRRDRLVKMNNLGLESDVPYRKIDHIWEYFMPPLEIDKSIRSVAFILIKGRNLVKVSKEKTE